MDRTTLARKLREALFDHIEAGRRDALQDSAIDSLFEKVLASWGKPLAGEVNLVSPEELCRTWTSQLIEIAPQPACQCPACRHDQMAHASDCAVHNGACIA